MTGFNTPPTYETDSNVDARPERDRRDTADDLVVIDDQTGLWRRNHFFTRLNEELSRASRQQSTLTLLLIDARAFLADGSDRSHRLKLVAQSIRESCRSSDVAGRISKQEFALLLLDGEGITGKITATRIQDNIKSKTEAVGETAKEQIVRIGIAVSKRGLMGPAQLMKEADKVLYGTEGRSRNPVD